MSEIEEEQRSEGGIVTISKECLATLPAEEFKGQICLIDTLEKVDEAIEDLKTWSMIGFDTETRPSFRKGVVYNVSLVQLATPERCYLFRINEIGFPESLKNILEDENITKVGLSIHDDFLNIGKIVAIEPQSFIDLQSYVKDFNIKDNSLSRIYGILFDKRISKGQRLTNWEASELSEAQQIYAALDAFACVKIYDYLEAGNFFPEKSKYLTFPTPPETDD